MRLCHPSVDFEEIENEPTPGEAARVSGDVSDRMRNASMSPVGRFRGDRYSSYRYLTS